jgi:predicted phage-related endonuclease
MPDSIQPPDQPHHSMEPPPPKMVKVTKKYRKLLGPSQFATVLGLDKYQSRETLQYEIENGYVPSGSYATQFGNDNESVALYYYQKLNHVTVTKANFAIDEKHPRIGGCCDGLIDDKTGLEIKCHVRDENLLTELPINYLLQMAGYMHLYKREKWILVSNVFNADKTLKKYKIFEVTWDEVKDRWIQEWYPQLVDFVDNVKWIH